MKLVIEKSIPFIEGVFEPYGEVVYLDGAEISHNDLLNVDGLIIRTRTKCNAALLDGTNVKMIATAAIGSDTGPGMNGFSERGMILDRSHGIGDTGGFQGFPDFCR